MGGFSGSDPILTPDQLQNLVTSGQLRFVMIGWYTFETAKRKPRGNHLLRAGSR